MLKKLGTPLFTTPLRNVNFTSEYRGLNMYCLEGSIDGFYLVKDADAWCRGLEFKGWQQHHARGAWLARRLSLKMFLLSPIAKNDFYTSIPHGWDHGSNRSHGVPTLAIISYLPGHLRISCLKVWEHLFRIADV